MMPKLLARWKDALDTLVFPVRFMSFLAGITTVLAGLLIGIPKPLLLLLLGIVAFFTTVVLIRRLREKRLREDA